MYIPTFFLVIVVLGYFYYQSRREDEISSLRDEIRDIRNTISGDNSRYEYESEYVAPTAKEPEYTFQESQDRSTVGVKYDATDDEMSAAYKTLRKELNPHGSSESMRRFIEVRAAYERLIAKNYTFGTKSK